MADVSLTDLTAGYGEWPVLDGLSLTARSGRVVSVVGPNGAGKTTLLNTVAGRITPTAGEIRIDGELWNGLPVFKRVRAGLAYVPEDRGIPGELTVKETLDAAVTTEAGSAFIQRSFTLFPNLQTRQDVPAQNLSGGEQQMLAIARALTLTPKVLLLDEPTLGLAPKMVEIVRQFLEEATSTGTTVILAEQNLRFVSRVADDVLLLARGRLESIDPERLSSLDEFFGLESVAEVGKEVS